MTLTKGTMAFYDTTFSGLVPCKVLAVRYNTPEPAPMHFEFIKQGISSRYRVDIVVTEMRGAYIKGEVIKDLPAYDVVPRPCFKHKTGLTSYILNYQVEVGQ